MNPRHEPPAAADLKSVRVSRLTTAGILLLALLTAAGDRSSAPTLEVRSADRGIVWQGPIAAGERFELAFTHSVERTRWVHHYHAGAGVIVQCGSTFGSFGAGVPVASADGSPLARMPDGYFAESPMRIPVLRMLNSHAADLTLGHRGRGIAIGRLLDDLEAFEIRVR